MTTRICKCCGEWFEQENVKDNCCKKCNNLKDEDLNIKMEENKNEKNAKEK